MRYILYIITFLLSTQAFGQGTWNRQAVNNKINRSQSDSVAIMPRDTAATNEVINPATGQPVGDSGRIAYMFGKFWGHNATGWSEFGGGAVPSSRFINTTSPLSGGGDLSADRILSIANAQADGENKGAATFRSDHFDDDGSGAISLDTVNGPNYTKTQSDIRYVHYTDTAAMLASRWDSAHVKSYTYSKDSSNILYVSKLNTITDGNSVITTADSLSAFGDSYTVGVGAGNTQRAYINLLGNRGGYYVLNHAISGVGVFQMTKQCFQRLEPVGNKRLVTILAGFNDIWKGEGGFKTLAKVFWGYRSMLVNAFLKTATPASALTFTGSWSAINVDTLGGKAFYLSGTGMSTSTINDTAIYNFTGPNIVVGTFATDGIIKKSPQFAIMIDGDIRGVWGVDSTTDAIADATYSNVYMPANVILQDLGPGAHTLKVFNLGNDGPLILDYVGTMQVPDSCAPVVVGQMPKLQKSTLDMLLSVYGKNVNNQMFADGDSMMKAAIKTVFIGYPVAFAPLGNYCDPVIDNIPSNVHYNDLGHQHIADAFGSVIKKQLPNNLANVTSLGNSTPNIIRLSGFNNQPTIGAGMELSYNSTLRSGVSAIYSYDQTGSLYKELNLRGNPISIDAGNLLVGSVTDGGQKLQVTGDSYMNGKLGVGVASAIGTLHVNSAGSTGFYLQNTNSIGASSGAFVRLYQNGTPVNANDQLAGILIGTNSTGTTYETGATIVAKSTEAWTGSSRPTYWSFNTVPSGSTVLSERMRITAPGNVGINTSFPTSFIHVRGRMADTVITVTGNTTLTVNHSTVLVNNSGSITITLPAAATCAGAKYTIKKISAASNDVIIDPDSAETIDAAASKTLTLQYSSVIIQSNGTAWYIIGGHVAATTY